MVKTGTTGRRFSISRAALKTALVYAVFGLLWIRFSDLFLASIIHDAETMTTVQTYKGWLFIVVTATLLFVLVRRNMQSLRMFESSLSSAKSFIESTIDAMPSVLIGVDESLSVTHWNATAIAMTGLDASEVMGRFLPDVFPLLKQQVHMISECIRSNRVSSFDVEHDVVDGILETGNPGGEGPPGHTTRNYSVQIFPLQGDYEGAVVRVDDITERVRVQEMLVQTEKMMSVGGLAAGMAHEINNPLGGILQGVQNIKRRLSSDLPTNQALAAEVRCDLDAMGLYLEQRGVNHMLDGVFESGKRAAEIVSNMLDFARTTDMSHSGVDINALLDKALSLMDKDYDLEKRYDFNKMRIVKEYAEDMPMVTCSRIGIEQVVVNLLRNAAQALAGYNGGEGWNPEITLRTYAQDASAFIEIVDNGPGMTEEQRRRAFEPFYTTKPVGEGTGLGLSVSYYIITNSHKGVFELHTRLGHGTLFRIVLPCNGCNVTE